VNKELAEIVGRVYMSPPEWVVKEWSPEVAFMTGVMLGVSLMRSHPEVALSIHEHCDRGQEAHLLQIASTDQMIETIKEELSSGHK
jgi:hypothetical protein